MKILYGLSFVGSNDEYVVHISKPTLVIVGRWLSLEREEAGF